MVCDVIDDMSGSWEEDMKKAVGYLITLLKGILFIGFSIQIIFGLVWMCFNFMQVQAFGEPEGTLYPLLLRVFGGVPQVLYLLQLGLAWFCTGELLKPIVRSRTIWQNWYVLVLLTLPFSMQCHLALLPYSFVCSLLFLEVSFCRNAMTAKQGISCVDIAKGSACWLILALLLPEYKWLGGIPMVLVVLFRVPALAKKLRRMAYSFLIIAAFGGMIVGLDRLPGAAEEQGKSFWFLLAHRICWPTVWNDASVWPEELKTATEPILWETTYNSGNMERLFKPALENAVGVEQAENYYRLMTNVAWQLHSSVIIRQMGGDVLVYVLPQVILPLQLEGIGYDSFSGRNYEIMLGKHFRLTKYYVNYSCWWFIVAFGTALFLAVLRMALGEKVTRRRVPGFLIICALSAGAITMYYIMRGAGISDYKCTLAVSAAWTVWMLYMA